MRVVDDDGNIIKTGDPETDAVSEPAERTLKEFSHGILSYFGHVKISLNGRKHENNNFQR